MIAYIKIINIDIHGHISQWKFVIILLHTSSILEIHHSRNFKNLSPHVNILSRKIDTGYQEVQATYGLLLGHEQRIMSWNGYYYTGKSISGWKPL